MKNCFFFFKLSYEADCLWEFLPPPVISRCLRIDCFGWTLLATMTHQERAPCLKLVAMSPELQTLTVVFNLV